jgi:hypothetical protein
MQGCNLSEQHQMHWLLFMQGAQAFGCFAFCAAGELTEQGRKVVTSQRVLISSVHGCLDVQEYLTMLELARQGCQRISEFAKLSLDKVFS